MQMIPDINLEDEIKFLGKTFSCTDKQEADKHNNTYIILKRQISSEQKDILFSVLSHWLYHGGDLASLSPFLATAMKKERNVCIIDKDLK